jgi:predicted transcriptional regulator
MKVAEVMSAQVAVVSPDDPIQEAAQAMLDEDIGSFSVGREERLVSMVTDQGIALHAVALIHSAVCSQIGATFHHRNNNGSP